MAQSIKTETPTEKTVYDDVKCAWCDADVMNSFVVSERKGTVSPSRVYCRRCGLPVEVYRPVDETGKPSQKLLLRTHIVETKEQIMVMARKAAADPSRRPQSFQVELQAKLLLAKVVNFVE